MQTASENRPSPAAPSAGQRFRTAEAVVATRQADTTILLDLRSGRYYTLNAVGGRVWSLLAEGASLGQVMERVTEEFDAPGEQLANDVEAFMRHLLSARLVQRGS